MIIVDALNAREGVISFAAVVFAVQRITEYNANAIKLIYLNTFSDDASHIRVRNVFAFKGNQNFLFRAQWFS